MKYRPITGYFVIVYGISLVSRTPSTTYILDPFGYWVSYNTPNINPGSMTQIMPDAINNKIIDMYVSGGKDADLEVHKLITTIIREYEK